MATYKLRQKQPLKLGDIVRVLEDPLNDRNTWRLIAVVSEVDLDFHTNGGYPYRMFLVEGSYSAEIWISRYELIGNVTEAVALLQKIKRKA